MNLKNPTQVLDKVQKKVEKGSLTSAAIASTATTTPLPSMADVSKWPMLWSLHHASTASRSAWVCIILVVDTGKGGGPGSQVKAILVGFE